MRIFSLLMMLLSFSVAADVTIVGVSGYGTGENGTGQPSGAHDNLPVSAYSTSFKITHQTPKAKLEEIVKGTKCKGLIIMANSWGSGTGHRLAKIYELQCGEPVELFVMVDGVSKPIGPFKKTPPARRCVNYFQRKSTVRGNAIEGCENTDLSHLCAKGGLGDCHVQIEWEGTAAGQKLIQPLLR